MPQAADPVALDRVSVVCCSQNREQCQQVVAAVQKHLADVAIEEITIDEAAASFPSGVAVLLLFDATMATNAAARQWLAQWHDRSGWIPTLPLALDPQHGRPPAPFEGVKARCWPDDCDEVVTTLGAYLGMAIRPGKTRLFISYRSIDGAAAAQALQEHLAEIGFQAWLDEANDVLGGPNLEIGDKVQDKIAENLAAANALILLDSPQAPASGWIRIELELALGRFIPIVPVLLTRPGERTRASRFRAMEGLHRLVRISAAEVDGKLQLSAGQLAEIATEVQEYLYHLYRYRTLQPRRLERLFRDNKWQFLKNLQKQHLFDASPSASNGSLLRMLACCSFEDTIFAPSVRVFLRDIRELAKINENFARHLYFYPGTLLFQQDLALLSTEIPELGPSNTELIHYEEAVARVTRITGALNAFFA